MILGLSLDNSYCKPDEKKYKKKKDTTKNGTAYLRLDDCTMVVNGKRWLCEICGASPVACLSWSCQLGWGPGRSKIPNDTCGILI
jgi:hypothetical protein